MLNAVVCYEYMLSPKYIIPFGYFYKKKISLCSQDFEMHPVHTCHTSLYIRRHICRTITLFSDKKNCSKAIQLFNLAMLALLNRFKLY